MEFPLRFTICFLRSGENILLLNRNRPPHMGMWNGVGGKLDRGESPPQGVLREVREETGIVATTVRFVGVVTWQDVATCSEAAASRSFSAQSDNGAAADGWPAHNAPRDRSRSGGVAPGGMYTFVSELSDPQTELIDPSTREGVLAWKPLTWILHPDNRGIAPHVPRFLTSILRPDHTPCEFRCLYDGDLLVRHDVLPLINKEYAWLSV